MNIRRGFFRVWFVLSVLWIVGVIYTGYENTKYVNPDYEDIRKAAYSAMSDKGLMAEAKKQNIPIDGVTGTVRKGWESDFVPDGTLGTVEMPDGTVVRNVPVCLATTTFTHQRQLFLPTDDNYNLCKLARIV